MVIGTDSSDEEKVEITALDDGEDSEIEVIISILEE
jgi:hypothetical protein